MVEVDARVLLAVEGRPDHGLRPAVAGARVCFGV